MTYINNSLLCRYDDKNVFLRVRVRAREEV